MKRPANYPLCRYIHVCTYICGYKYIHVHTNMIYDLCYQIFEDIYIWRDQLPTIARHMPANAPRIIERSLYSRQKSPIHLSQRNPTFPQKSFVSTKEPNIPAKRFVRVSRHRATHARSFGMWWTPGKIYAYWHT